MSKILSEVATGNGDVPVNDENSSVGNFVIAEACEIILGQCTEMKLKMMKIYKILKCPNFVKVSTKESPCSCFKGRQLQATLQFHFHKINYIDQNFNFN